MNKIVTHLTMSLLAGSAVAVLGTQAASAAAPANTACVTWAEFHRVSTGITTARVAEIFGTEGHQTARVVTDGNVFTQREYPPCSGLSYVSISFKNGHETSKTAD